jgi:peptidoglycan LD-endopeptidase LytH
MHKTSKESFFYFAWGKTIPSCCHYSSSLATFSSGHSSSRPGVKMRRFILLILFFTIFAFILFLLKDTFYVARLILQDAPSVLSVPVANVSVRNLRDTWGASRSEGREHQGIDIFAAKGTPVVSTTRGIVWKIGQNRLGGNAVWVLGPGGQLHYYAHLDRFSGIQVRDRIVEGTVLGFVGNTGNAARTQPHLHYGIYTLSGEAFNPFPLLRLNRQDAKNANLRP